MFTSNRGVRLYWNETGSGTPVLLIMGHCFSSEMWYPVISDLATRHRVVWFDNRGTGASASTYNATMADLANDAQSVMDAAGLESAHIYGVSMGGFIALNLAIENPERVQSLALGCTAMNIDLLPRPFAPWLMYRLPEFLLRQLLRKGYPDDCSVAEIEHDMEVFLSSPRSPKGLMAQHKAILGYGYDAQQISSIEKPALVIHGSDDRNVPCQCGEELAEALPQAKFMKYAGAAHNFMMTHSKEANQEVLEHFADVDTLMTSAH